MRPALAPRGRWFAAAGLVLLATGAVAGVAALSALGLCALSALLYAYIRHAPRAAGIFEGGVKLAWWIEAEADPASAPGGGTPQVARSIVAGRKVVLHVALRCHSSAPVGVARLRPVAHPALEVAGTLVAALQPGHEARLEAPLWPRASGSYVLHGAALELDDPLGLFRAQAYFPNPLTVPVLPRALGLAPAPLLVGAAAPERAGRRLFKRAGLGGELREIREHAHGDPWKRIAWAATARTGQLMVRELEMDVTYTYHLLVDATATMRHGTPGQTGLDTAIEGATAVARAALAQGDRVALTVFSSRLLSDVPTGSTASHLHRIVSALLSARRPVAEDQIDATEGELAQLVARYLRHQEGIETRLGRVPALEDRAWSHILTGPRGELFDLGVLGRACRALLGESEPRAALEERGRGDPDLGALRRFCARRAIELPLVELAPAPHGRAVADALVAAALPRGARVLLLWTALGKQPEDEPSGWREPLRRALGLLRRRHHRLSVLVPAAGLGAAEAEDAGRTVQALLARTDRRRAVEAAGRLKLAGAAAQVVSADEPPAAWLGRLGRPGSARFSAVATSSNSLYRRAV